MVCLLSPMPNHLVSEPHCCLLKNTNNHWKPCTASSWIGKSVCLVCWWTERDVTLLWILFSPIKRFGVFLSYCVSYNLSEMLENRLLMLWHCNILLVISTVHYCSNPFRTWYYFSSQQYSFENVFCVIYDVCALCVFMRAFSVQKCINIYWFHIMLSLLSHRLWV